MCILQHIRRWSQQVFSTYINFNLNQSGTDKSYSCHNHPHCHSFQRSVESTLRSVIDLYTIWENHSTKCLNFIQGNLLSLRHQHFYSEFELQMKSASSSFSSAEVCLEKYISFCLMTPLVQSRPYPPMLSS